MKWFQPNSFGEVCFLEESYENMQKIQILTILRVPSINIRGYAFNCFGEMYFLKENYRRIPKKKSNIEQFESTLFMKSQSMHLLNKTNINQSMQYGLSWCKSDHRNCFTDWGW